MTPEEQIERLSRCIMTHWPQEPGATGTSEGAVDVAVRLLERFALAEPSACEALLMEWLHTPFFETRDDWERWVSNYRPRVCAALGLRDEP
jgi:hypothetical protein